MNKLTRISLLAFGALLAACSSDDPDFGPPPGNAAPAGSFRAQVVHASPDAPAVDVLVNGAVAISDLDYKEASDVLTLDGLTYLVEVQALLPEGTLSVIGPDVETFADNWLYRIVAINSVGTGVDRLVVGQEDLPIAAGESRLRILHAAPLAPEVTVYATTPGAPLAGAAPVGTFSYKGDLGPVDVPAGDYQIRVTLPPDMMGNPGALVLDAGTVTLNDGDDLLIAAVENTVIDTTPISLVVAGPTGAAEIFNVGTMANVRAVHASPDTGAVDVLVNDAVAIPGLIYPNPAPADGTSFIPLMPDTYNFKVTPAGMPGMIAIEADLPLATGENYDIVAAGVFADISAIVANDDYRRVATEAKLRLIHASPTAGPVDVYLTAPDADITTLSPTLPNVALKANTGFLSITPGTYDISVTQTGMKDVFILVEDLMLGGSGVYTAIARDAEGGAGGLPLGLILLDDLAP